ncbi:G-protein gamma-like domain,DEP domain,Winged helix-turn-helix DNA-binding domain,RGS domain,RGS [Cinara cedri]|uniref:G-protein gamma-like domain,DEP domain,Winged helix-turn-helix DNA-binding domain,RGS domain,RGS n=1 Tax=Cinara cedri TaxID=506608 RepID=A0A5E4MAC6_9HEMI|nr:G-protein gamma-like domain,DEP domain,Winged helix-turn-helix DNA-binding domain,RGS domain,RGS [Cinara cedri]
MGQSLTIIGSERSARRKKQKADELGDTPTVSLTAASVTDLDNVTQHQIVYKKMEQLMDRMQDENIGLRVRTVNKFRAKVPSVFTGTDLIIWMMNNLDVDDQVEALYLANLLSSHGYLFPIDDHFLNVKNDGSYYRFQTPYYWPSNIFDPENTDYAVYLCKRTMQNKKRLELADYEAENLAKLQKVLSRKWEFVFLQAEAQSKVDKKRDRMERKVLDSQERAFWDVHRPMPGTIITTEIDYRKLKRYKDVTTLPNGDINNLLPIPPPIKIINKPTVESLKKDITAMRLKLDRRNIKLSKIADTYITYFEQYAEYDPFFTPPEISNPWLLDNIEVWDCEKHSSMFCYRKEVTVRRIKRWAFSLKELLADPAGKEHFTKFLEKEFSCENLKFWEAVQNLKKLPQREVPEAAQEIWTEYLSGDSLNIDSQSRELSRKNMSAPDRWAFDIAAVHVYHLMKSDSYQRYIRSEMYKEYLNTSKKKTSMKGIRSIVSFSGKRDICPS